MGRRIRNNYRWKNLGYANYAEKLDLRELLKLGIVSDGNASRFDPANTRCGLALAELRQGYNNRLLLEKDDFRQIIKLVNRSTNFGGRRWYMLDEKGRQSEVLYRAAKYFWSREFVGLSYVSQSEPRWSRQKLKLRKIADKLEGTGLCGPARGDNRLRLKAERDRMEFEIEDTFERDGRPLVVRFMSARRRRKTRRQQSEERFNVCEKAMNFNKDGLRAEAIRTLYEPVLNRLKLKTPHRALDIVVNVNKDQKDLPTAQVDFGFLRRLGFAKPSKLVGDQLGWPPSWIQQNDRRLYFLIDMRAPGRECAVFIVQDQNRPPRSQFFWLKEGIGAFGRRQWFFWDHMREEVSDRLRYGHGGFRYHDDDQSSSDGWDFNRAAAETETWLVQSEEEEVADEIQIKVRTD